MQQVKLLLADNHRIFLEGLSSLLNHDETFDFRIVCRAINGENVLSFLDSHNIDLIILELNLEKTDGLEILTKLQPRKGSIKKIVLSRYDNPKIVKEAFKFGADGYILKSSDFSDLVKGIKEVMAGNSYLGKNVVLQQLKVNGVGEGNAYHSINDKFIKKHSLTKREIQILKLIIQAMNNKQIAKQLFISDQTVSVHRKNIMRKLGVSNTAGLIKAAYENFIVK